MKIKRGQIYIADLDQSIGSEQSGVRPVLILQNNVGNKHSPTTIVASISTKYRSKPHLPTHYYLPENTGLRNRSFVMLEQIRVIDKARLHKYIGDVPPRFMNIINQKISISLGMRPIRKRGIER